MLFPKTTAGDVVRGKIGSIHMLDLVGPENDQLGDDEADEDGDGTAKEGSTLTAKIDFQN